MGKRIAFTVFILLWSTSFAFSAGPKHESTNALFFQYAYDNELRQIDSIGAYMRLTTLCDSNMGGSLGTTFELPIGYDNDKLSFKMSLFGGLSYEYTLDDNDTLLTIGPCTTATMLIDTYYISTMFDLGILADFATSYPVSERVSATMGGSFIYDIARYSIYETATTTCSGFEEGFSQLSGRIYLGFSVNK